MNAVISFLCGATFLFVAGLWMGTAFGGEEE